MVLPVEDCVACRGAGLFRYGGIGTIIFPVSSAGFANSGAITKTANAELCSTIEIPTARRLIFLSRVFFCVAFHQAPAKCACAQLRLCSFFAGHHTPPNRN